MFLQGDVSVAFVLLRGCWIIKKLWSWILLQGKFSKTIHMLYKLAAISQHYFHLFFKYQDKFGYEKACARSQ